MPDVKIVGHRGASGHELENSMASFQKAIDMGAAILEMDLRLTKDGEVVVFHDDKVNRVTRSKGNLGQLSLEQLRAIKLRNGEDIPTLKEVLERFRGRCQFFLEIKVKAAALSSYEVVREMGMLHDVVFITFSGPWLLGIKARDKDARVGFGTRDRKQNNIQISTSLKAELICLEKKLATGEAIAEAKAQMLDVYVWTVDRPKQMRKFIELGADGIITNKPDLLRKELEDL